MRRKLIVLPDTFTICRLGGSEQIPDWAALNGSFFSITRTRDELTIVCNSDNVPVHVTAQRGWRACKIDGILDFSLTGIISSLTNPLAKAEISVFVISTYDTDYLLLHESSLEKAVLILQKSFDIARLDR